MASDVVIPPGLLISKSAESINSAMLWQKP